jgi:hypothetical protein
MFQHLPRKQECAGGAAEQASADLAGLTREGQPAVLEHVDQGALADLEPEQIRHPVVRTRSPG